MCTQLWYRLSMSVLIIVNSIVFYIHSMLWGYPNFLSPGTIGFLSGLWAATEMRKK